MRPEREESPTIGIGCQAMGRASGIVPAGPREAVLVAAVARCLG